MMRRFWFPVLVVLSGLLFVLTLSLPARIVPYFLDGQMLQLSGVAGTLRAGKASRARLQLSGAYFHLGELRWDLAVLSLLALKPTLQVSSDWGNQRGSVELRLQDEILVLRAVDLNLDAALLRQVLPVELEGRLAVLFEEIRVGEEDILRADGRLVWQEAAWQSPGGRRSLGSYAANFSSPADQQINAKIVTLSGPVTATGTASLNQNRYAVDVFIQASGQGFDADLAQALSLVASPEKNGYRLRLSGELTPGS